MKGKDKTGEKKKLQNIHFPHNIRGEITKLKAKKALLKSRLPRPETYWNVSIHQGRPQQGSQGSVAWWNGTWVWASWNHPLVVWHEQTMSFPSASGALSDVANNTSSLGCCINHLRHMPHLVGAPIHSVIGSCFVFVVFIPWVAFILSSK